MKSNSELPAIRSVKDFLEDFKKQKLEEGEDIHSDLVRFLNWLITNVKEDATLSQKQENELTKRIDWDWWSNDGEPSWYIFLQLFETLPK
jgi:hypothetical protein